MNIPEHLIPITGIIQTIRQSGNNCCEVEASIINPSGITNIRVTPDTYVAGSIRLLPGMTVTAFYDGNAPVPLIFPLRYTAVMIGRKSPQETIYAGYFDENLIAADQKLALNISESTQIITANGQRFLCSPGNHILMVYYTVTTRSIPPLTTPRKIIVMC